MAISRETADQQPAPATKPEGSGKWYDGLPEELTSHGDVTGTDSLEKFVGRYIDQRGTLSKSVRIPTEDAGAEELEKFYESLTNVPKVARIPDLDDTKGWSDLYAKMGVPSEAAAYNLTDKELAEEMHKLNLNGGQAERLAKYLEEKSSGQAAKRDEQNEIDQAELKREWGDTYERRMMAASKMVREYGGDEVFDFLEANGLGNNAALAKMMHKLQVKITGGKMLSGEALNTGMDRAELQNRIKSVMANKDDPYHNKSHPEHHERVRQVAEYYKKLSS